MVSPKMLTKKFRNKQGSLKLPITMVFYPQLTKFWIILIFNSSEDLALIRWLKEAKSILMASEGQERL